MTCGEARSLLLHSLLLQMVVVLLPFVGCGETAEIDVVSSDSSLAVEASIEASNCRKLQLRREVLRSLGDLNDREVRDFYQHIEEYPRAFMPMVPVFACPDEERIGGGFDGGKWVCGLNRLPADCVIVPYRNCCTKQVYSFGSCGNDQFEVGIKSVAPQCEIHTFDPGDYENKVSGADVLTYHRNGLASADNPHSVYKTLPTFATELNHSHIHILKIDIEGMEYNALRHLFLTAPSQATKVPRVDQILVELHIFRSMTFPTSRFGVSAFREFMTLMNLLHERGFLLFHIESNLISAWCCIELALVHITSLPMSWRPQCSDEEVAWAGNENRSSSWSPFESSTRFPGVEELEKLRAQAVAMLERERAAAAAAAAVEATAAAAMAAPRARRLGGRKRRQVVRPRQQGVGFQWQRKRWNPRR